MPDLGPGEELKLNKFLVEIVARRLEGKSHIKEEVNKKITPIGSFSLNAKKNITKSFNAARASSGNNSVSKCDTAGGDRLKRKAFVCPSKSNDELP